MLDSLNWGKTATWSVADKIEPKRKASGQEISSNSISLVIPAVRPVWSITTLETSIEI